MTEVFAVPGNSRENRHREDQDHPRRGHRRTDHDDRHRCDPATAMAPASVVVVSRTPTRTSSARRPASAHREPLALPCAPRTPIQPEHRGPAAREWAKRGTHGYHNQCLRLADNAYQPKGNRTRHRAPPVAAGQEAWATRIPATAGRRTARRCSGGPRTRGPHRHLRRQRQGRDQHARRQGQKINWKKMNSWGGYLGWAEPYYG